MQCRERCGACCIAPAISQPFYGMPQGKPAGVSCIHLDKQMRCDLFGDARRPKVCGDFMPEVEFCGHSAAEAINIMLVMEGVEPNSLNGSE